MAKSGIVVNKLILTIHGNDYAFTNLTPQQIPSEPTNYQTNWENGFTGSTNYYTLGRYGAEYEENPPWNHRFSTFMQVAGTGNFDLYNYLFQLLNGEYLHIWREDTGRNLALAIRRDNASQFTLYTYVYGTYTTTGAFPNSNIATNEDYLPRQVKMSFGYDDVSERYMLYMFNMGSSFSGTPSYYSDIQCQMIAIGNATVAPILVALLSGNTPAPPSPSSNPYGDGSFSEPSGDPTGDYDDTSDVISVPSIPSFNLGLSKLINVWVPSTTDINNLATYLWSNFDLTDPTKTLSKMFTDPLSYILSLHLLPFTVNSSSAITVTLAGLATTVSMPPATIQFKDIDCGSVTINEYWGNYLDYTYTKIVLCLPFCGQVDLDPDEVMGKTIKVKYRVDIITGAFVCFVYIDGDKVLGQYAGNCAAQIPISAADFSRLNAAVLGVAGAAASAFGSAALGGHGGMLNGASGGLISSIAANAQNAKIRAQHSGGLTGAPGFMGIQKPYLIIHRPRQSVPEDYEQFKGYPSNVTMQLSSCNGFTSVREININGLPFTDGELTELKSILEGGVIL